DTDTVADTNTAMDADAADTADTLPDTAADTADSVDSGPDAADTRADADTTLPDLGYDFVYDQAIPRNTAWYVDGGHLWRRGERFPVRGINWFGLETTDRAPHGLWTGRTIESFLDQIAALGFNAVRLPLSPDVIRPDLPCASWAVDGDLDTGRELLEHVIDLAAARDLAILLDFHTCSSAIPGGTAGSPSDCVGYDTDDWLADLAVLAGIAAEHDDTVLGVDLFNEPHELTWPQWRVLAEDAARVVLTNAPTVVVFVQGVADRSDTGGYVPFWGENLHGALAAPPAIPGARLVYTPHVYGPGVHAQTYFSAGDFPANMPTVWDAHFGALEERGDAVVIGEFGGWYDDGIAPGEVAWNDAIVAYIEDRGLGFFYWALNPTSVDTGGLLEGDWATLRSARVTLLAPLLAP
ncbi:MAG: glycoside hydrolase family 5 protein, partial [Myxococcales bacterium]|nr:glycoside hydrolase family 5 protein [Myxococcales bacterium]